MANPTVTNVDLASVVYESGRNSNELLTLAGADTIVDGTILARKAIDQTVTVTPDGGNTGDGTVTLAAPASGDVVASVGDYTLECIVALTNGGTFKLLDPSGIQVAGSLVMTVGAGAATPFEAGGLVFTITDGATDFVVGDKFTLTTTVDGNMYLYATDGVGGVQKALMVYTGADLVVTGAGDYVVRPMKTGGVRAERLVIDADGDASNITAAILDELRSAGIYAQSVTDDSVLDNQ
jgi:hypothetical protein